MWCSLLQELDEQGVHYPCSRMHRSLWLACSFLCLMHHLHNVCQLRHIWHLSWHLVGQRCGGASGVCDARAHDHPAHV